MAKPVYDKPLNMAGWRDAAGKSTDQDRNLSGDQFGGSKPEAPDDFQLPPDREAYYAGQSAGEAHREALAKLKGSAAKNNYTKGLREGLVQNDPPKRGDIDHPLKRDQPKPPRAPRQPRQVDPVRQAQRTAKRIGSLSRMAKGRRR